MKKFKRIFLGIIVFCFFLIGSSSGQWVQISNGMGNDKSIRTLTVIGNNIFASVSSPNYPYTNYGIYLSTNNGISWNQSGLNNVGFVFSSVTSGNNIFVGTYGQGVYLSTNIGTNWIQAGLDTMYIWSLAVSGNNIYAGTSAYGLYLSTNNGTNWTNIGLYGQVIHSLALNGNNIYAGTENNHGLFISTNNGSSWNTSVLSNRTVKALAVSGNNIFAGTDSGLYISTNNGTNWTSSMSVNINTINIFGNNIFVGNGTGVYLSTNNGISWLDKSQGLGVSPGIYVFAFMNNYIFLGTWQISVWRRSLSEIIRIKSLSTEIPTSHSLSQNYPNPFNPSTNIRYQISKNSFVTLKIFDILGKEIETPVNEKQTAGTYEIIWDASKYPSGIYFYKLEAEKFSEVKKMILIK